MAAALLNLFCFEEISFLMSKTKTRRREGLQMRYAELGSAALDIAGSPPPFHHGSHYSSPAAVLFWLIRQEPFTSLHLALQNGRFDHADRLFTSLAGAWEGVWNNPSDCKEMVPELFYDASYLRNDNGFDFGMTQVLVFGCFFWSFLFLLFKHSLRLFFHVCICLRWCGCFCCAPHPRLFYFL